MLLPMLRGEVPLRTAGLKEGDLIVEVNRTPVENKKQYLEVLEEAKEGDRILFWITRDRNSMFLVLTLDND